MIDWLSDLDSNQDKSLQRALCYRYTIGQTAPKLAFSRPAAKQKLRCEHWRLAVPSAGGGFRGLLGLLGYPLLITPLGNGERHGAQGRRRSRLGQEQQKTPGGPD